MTASLESASTPAEHAAPKPESEEGARPSASPIPIGGSKDVPSSPPITDPMDDTKEKPMRGEESSAKSDSEAETIVISGVEGDGSPKKARTIKHEDDADADNGKSSEAPDTEMADVDPVLGEGGATVEDAGVATAVSGKKETEKEVAGPEAGNSSGLSSALSSPMAGTQQTSKKDTSDSEQPTTSLSRTSAAPLAQEASNTPEPVSRKRKASDRESDAEDGHPERRRRGSLEAGVHTNKDRRETRSGTARPGSPKTNSASNNRPSHDRSPSPRLRAHRRTASLSSSNNLTNGNTHKRRKVPPPLSATRESKETEDGQSDSGESPQPQSAARKLVSGDGSAQSPNKMPFNKKGRDQIGRTRLARGITGDEPSNVVQVLHRLRERPHEINVPDNAGNTPLQIASLSGYIRVVKLLVEHGCEVNTQNDVKDTPLIDAVENDHLDVVQVLLNAGANPRQSNLNGMEPLDLVPVSGGNAEAIRKALTKAKQGFPARRQSEDQNGHDNAAAREKGPSSGGVSAHSPRHSPPPTASRSPPPVAVPGRRKTVRSEVTRNDLLWIKPTVENLRDRASKGDLAAVVNILNVLGQADSQSLIAAARGGHDEVIQILLGIGGADADPKPVKSMRPDSNTPMLAAIGRGNEKVVQLLLDQPKFDPTRLDHRGYTYYEVAKERQGLNWQDEYETLKAAFDKQAKGRKVKAGTPMNSASPALTQGGHDRDSRRRARTHSSSPTVSSNKKPTRSPTRALEDPKIKREPTGKEESNNSSTRTSSTPHVSSSRTEDVPPISESKSEGDKSLLGPPKSKISKSQRSHSEASPLVLEGDASKPKRKLVSGKVFKGDLERKRRSSVISAESSSGQEAVNQSRNARGPGTTSHTRAQSTSSLKPSTSDSETSGDGKSNQATKGKSKDRLSVVRDVGTKRSRSSASPPRSHSQESVSRKVMADDAKKKRRRLGPDGEGKPGSQAGPERPDKHDATVKLPRINRSTGDVVEADNRHAQKPEHPSKRKGTPNDRRSGSADHALNGENGMRETSKLGQSGHVAKEHERGLRKGSERSGIVDDEKAKARQAQEDKERREKEEAERLQRIEREREDQERREQQEAQKAKKREEEAQRKAEEEKRAAAEREAQLAAEKAEAERKARVEREEQLAREEERRRLEEAERQARIAREEEQARERKRREEELQRRRAEQERLRREEADKRRKENEERQRLELIQRQEELERLRREALPYMLQRLAELPQSVARTVEEARKFTPLFASPLKDIQPDCPPDQAEEIWVNNFQAAAVLGVKDLGLSQYTAWSKIPIRERHKVLLWRCVKMILAGKAPLEMHHKGIGVRDRLTQAKFRSMDTVFWLKLSDFMDIIPRYPHLQGLKITTCRVDLSRRDDPSTMVSKTDPEGHGWTVTPYENGTFTSYERSRHERELAELPHNAVLFRPVIETQPRVKQRSSMPNGVSHHE
ncbi:MAG: Ankyrin repeat domain-containing protein 11 [Piccolia ochrophora]|nr:MAG: Ankyrin repeat domain-containing protein 11 [Piccolia ochrophora]